MVIDLSCKSLLVGILLGFVCSASLIAQDPNALKLNDCPKILVIGPAGVFQPGDTIAFAVSIDPEPTVSLKLHWMTNGGKIIDGQSTRKIRVRYEMERGLALLTTVKIEGLPIHCANTASEVTPYEAIPEPELVSQFYAPITTINRKNLENAAELLNRYPNNQLYIIEYFPPGTSEASIKRKREKINVFMAKTVKFDVDRITFVAANAARSLTKIYRIPPGAANPTP